MTRRHVNAVTADQPNTVFQMRKESNCSSQKKSNSQAQAGVVERLEGEEKKK
jgi:hypothetical protein